MAESFDELGKTFPDSIIGFNAVALFAKMVWDSAQAAEALKPTHNTASAEICPYYRRESLHEIAPGCYVYICGCAGKLSA